MDDSTVGMPTTSINLEHSAYELLKARKKADESFSQELHRLLGSTSPELKGFLDIVSANNGWTIADAIDRLRAQGLTPNESRLIDRVVPIGPVIDSVSIVSRAA
jgi:predicted CopG family antitoxin